MSVVHSITESTVRSFSLLVHSFSGQFLRLEQKNMEKKQNYYVTAAGLEPTIT